MRKELVRKVSFILDEECHFTYLSASIDQYLGVKASKRDEGSMIRTIAAEFVKVMSNLSDHMGALRLSIEYIQDYVDLPGLKMWQEEIGRVISFYVERECNRFIKKKISAQNSSYQSDHIPIPVFRPSSTSMFRKDGCVNFMGRIMFVLLQLTSPTHSTFSPELATWFNPKNGQELCGIRIFSALGEALTPMGVRGLNQLLGFRVVYDTNKFTTLYKEQLFDTETNHINFLDNVRKVLYPEEKVCVEGSQFYQALIDRLDSSMGGLLGLIRSIGQSQLLRRQLSNYLQFSCRMDATLLYHSIQALDRSILRQMVCGEFEGDDEDDEEKDSDDEEEEEEKKEDDDEDGDVEEKRKKMDKTLFLTGFSKLLDSTGLNETLSTLFVVSKDPLEGLPVVITCLILAIAPRLEFHTEFGTLVQSTTSQHSVSDGSPIAAGIVTLLHQFHPSYLIQVIKYLGQYIRTIVSENFRDNLSGKKKKKGDLGLLNPQVIHIIILIEQMCKFSQTPRSSSFLFYILIFMFFFICKIVYQWIPEFVFNLIGYSDQRKQSS